MGSLRSLRSKVDEPVIVYPSDEEVIQAVKNNNLKELEALLKNGGNPNAEKVFHWVHERPVNSDNPKQSEISSSPSASRG